MSQPISRRSFLGLLFAAFLAFLLWFLRRSDLPLVVQQFFGIQQNIQERIESRFAALRRRNASLHQQSVLFFTFQQYHATILLPSKLKRNVISEWTDFLFNRREIAWPYVGYPSVNDFPICNGLIRN